MIQVQLSSKMWHKQLLFIMFPPKCLFQRLCAYTIMLCRRRKNVLDILSSVKIKDGVSVLDNKPRRKALAVFRDKAVKVHR